MELLSRADFIIYVASGGPVCQAKSRDPAKVLHIVGDQRAVMGQGARCEDQIEVIERSALFFEIGFQLSECLGRFLTDRYYLEGVFNGSYSSEV